MTYFKIIFAFVIGAGALFYSFKFIRLYFNVKNWDRVSAVVTSKEMFIHPKYSTSRTPYGIRATYTYSIKNTNYTGDKIYLVELIGGQANHIKSDAESRLNAIEKTTNVFVDPEDPTKSVMYCEGIGLYIIVFCMGILALLMGLGFMLTAKS